MPRKSKATESIEASTRAMVEELHRRQEQAADQIASIVDGYWKRLAQAIAGQPQPSDLIVATRLAHQAMAREIEQVFGKQLTGLLDYTHARAVNNVLKALPADWIEALVEKAVLTGQMPAGLPADQKKSVLKTRIFSSRQVDPGRVVRSLVADTTSLGDPQQIANTINAMRWQGKTNQQIARAIQPQVYGVKSTVRRVIRDSSQFATNTENLATWNQLAQQESDYIIGYQVHAVPRTKFSRPEHLERSGTIYYVRPKAGQKGLEEMPQPPYDRIDGRPVLMFNCRCWLSPVFAAQYQVQAA